jgi:hypothetical protein
MVGRAAHDAVLLSAGVDVDQGQLVRVGVRRNIKYSGGVYRFEMFVDLFDGIDFGRGHGEPERDFFRGQSAGIYHPVQYVQ